MCLCLGQTKLDAPLPLSLLCGLFVVLLVCLKTNKKLKSCCFRFSFPLGSVFNYLCLHVFASVLQNFPHAPGVSSWGHNFYCVRSRTYSHSTHSTRGSQREFPGGGLHPLHSVAHTQPLQLLTLFLFPLTCLSLDPHWIGLMVILKLPVPLALLHPQRKPLHVT